MSEPHKVQQSVARLIASISQMVKLRFKDMQCFVQGHTAGHSEQFYIR